MPKRLFVQHLICVFLQRADEDPRSHEVGHGELPHCPIQAPLPTALNRVRKGTVRQVPCQPKRYPFLVGAFRIKEPDY